MGGVVIRQRGVVYTGVKATQLSIKRVVWINEKQYVTIGESVRLLTMKHGALILEKVSDC